MSATLRGTARHEVAHGLVGRANGVRGPIVLRVFEPGRGECRYEPPLTRGLDGIRRQMAISAAGRVAQGVAAGKDLLSGSHVATMETLLGAEGAHWCADDEHEPRPATARRQVLDDLERYHDGDRLAALRTFDALAAEVLPQLVAFVESRWVELELLTARLERERQLTI